MKKFSIRIVSLITCLLLVASTTCFAATKTAKSANNSTTSSKIQMVLELTVNANGTSKFVNKQVVDDESYSMYSSNISAFNQKYAQYGMKFKMVKEGDKKYLAINQETKKGEAITFGASGNQDYTYRFAEKKGLFGKTYFVTAPFDMRQSLEDKYQKGAAEVLQFTVNLPYPARYSNATKVENMGKKLTWIGYESSPNPVQLAFFMPNWIAIIIFIIVLAAIIYLVFYLLKKKKKKGEVEVPDSVLEDAEPDGEVDSIDEVISEEETENNETEEIEMTNDNTEETEMTNDNTEETDDSLN